MAGRTRKSAIVRDIVIHAGGSVVLLEPLTARAHAVEPRYVVVITDAAQFDGLVVVPPSAKRELMR